MFRKTVWVTNMLAIPAPGCMQPRKRKETRVARRVSFASSNTYRVLRVSGFLGTLLPGGEVAGLLWGKLV